MAKRKAETPLQNDIQQIDGETRPLPIDVINTSGGTQTRERFNDATLAEYADAMIDGVDFPPVVVFTDGGTYWLADGFHRVESAKLAGWTEIMAEIHAGDRRAAMLYAVGANADHGLRRTNADKRKAVSILLADPEWRLWSNYQIAEACKVSDNFVRGCRNEVLTTNIRSDNDEGLTPELADKVRDITSKGGDPRVFTDKHGNASVMDAAKIGRKPEPVMEDYGDDDLEDDAVDPDVPRVAFFPSYQLPDGRVLSVKPGATRAFYFVEVRNRSGRTAMFHEVKTFATREECQVALDLWAVTHDAKAIFEERDHDAFVQRVLDLMTDNAILIADQRYDGLRAIVRSLSLRELVV